MLSASDMLGLFTDFITKFDKNYKGGDGYAYFKDVKLAERSLVIAKCSKYQVPKMGNKRKFATHY